MNRDHSGSRSTEILTMIEESHAENNSERTTTQSGSGARTAPPTVPFDGRLDRFAGDQEVECPDCEHGRADCWISEGATTHRFVCHSCGSTFEEGDR